MSSKAQEIKAARVDELMNEFGWKFIFFKGGDLMSGPGTHGFTPFDSRRFGQLVQQQEPGTSENMTKDFATTIKTIAPDWSKHSHYIGFGDGRVWDMEALDWCDQTEYVFQTNIIPQPAGSPGYIAAKQFLDQLAVGDSALARDYLQGIAPLYMARRPSGIVWFVGNGANGKSALLNTLYLTFGRHLANVNTAQLEDGKVIPVLNGVLGNIVREGSEARVEDSSNYKLLGTREPLSVRKLYTQEITTVDSDFHTIFNANNIPIFGDKTEAIRRRTLTIPFPAHFKDNPNFERETFTPEFLGGMVTLALEEAQALRDRGYRFEWSPATIAMQKEYNDSVNSAEAFVQYLKEKNVLGVFNWGVLERNYHFWCSDEGRSELGRQTLKRVLHNAFKPVKKTASVDGHNKNCLYFEEAVASRDKLVWLDNGYGFATPNEGPTAPTEIRQQEISSEW